MFPSINQINGKWIKKVQSKKKIDRFHFSYLPGNLFFHLQECTDPAETEMTQMWVFEMQRWTIFFESQESRTVIGLLKQSKLRRWRKKRLDGGGLAHGKSARWDVFVRRHQRKTAISLTILISASADDSYECWPDLSPNLLLSWHDLIERNLT